MEASPIVEKEVQGDCCPQKKTDWTKLLESKEPEIVVSTEDEKDELNRLHEFKERIDKLGENIFSDVDREISESLSGIYESIVGLRKCFGKPV